MADAVTGAAAELYGIIRTPETPSAKGRHKPVVSWREKTA